VPPATLLAPSPKPPTTAGGQILGYSKEHRAIFCLARGRADAPLRVLLLAGQHGDERPAQRTVESLLAMPPSELDRRLPNLQLGIIPEANPDGCAARSRLNADGIDLNRDHQLLRSEETAAIHQFVPNWQPHVVLDLHSYPSRRLHLLQHHVVLDHDVFIDVANHPAILARPGSVAGGEVLQGLLQALTAREVRAGRYTIVEASGRARHSTPDVVDARNGLALRYGVFTLLVENRQPRREEMPSERLRLQTAQGRALVTLLEWLSRNHDRFPSGFAVDPPAPGAPVQVRFKYQDHWGGLRLACRDADQGRPVSVMFSRYCASLEVRRSVILPAGYAVPRELIALRAVLRRHGFTSTSSRPGELSTAEEQRIQTARPSRRPGRSARRIFLAPHRVTLDLDRYEVFPAQQTGGEALAVFLEPESQHGLHRIVDMNLPLAAHSWYPVLRVSRLRDYC
jgi:hypothetical protein